MEVTGIGTAAVADRGDHTLVVTLAYNGAPYAGFSRQPGQETVQGELERALSTVMRREIDTVCAGRTDAGVHARTQVVSCPGFENDVSPRKMLRSLNALCGDSISVRDVRRVAPGFSARFDALAREYRYRIVAGAVPPLFLRDFAWWIRKPLDVDAMALGATHLLGEHDSVSFCTKASSIGKTTNRFVETILLTEEEHLGERCIVLRVVGNAFLHSMVRTMVGTLVEVGAGRRPESWVADALAARDREAAGPTAPAHGLTLWDVRYPTGVLVERTGR